MLNILRDLRWGRNQVSDHINTQHRSCYAANSFLNIDKWQLQEKYGEDPWLSGYL